MTTPERCPACGNCAPLTPEDSAALAAEYRRVIDTENRIATHAIATRYEDELNLHAFAAALRADLTPRQAEALAAWWDDRIPDRDGDAWVIAENYRNLANYLRRPAYDAAADAQAIIDDLWAAVDPAGTDRAARDAWRDRTGVDIDKLAYDAAISLATVTRTAA